MNCQSYEHDLIEIARNKTIPERRHAAFLEHIDNCNECRDRFTTQQRLSAAFRSIRSEEIVAPPFLQERLIQAFRETHNPKKAFHSNYMRRIAAVLAISLIAGLLVYQSRMVQQKADPVNQLESSGTEVVATDFIPLVPAPHISDSEQLVRVKLSRSALLQVGLPMNETRSGEPIEADVLVGVDGIPQAIRFIQRKHASISNVSY